MGDPYSTMFGIVLNHQVWFEWDDSLKPMEPCCDGLGHVERRAAQVERGSVWKLLKVCIYTLICPHIHMNIIICTYKTLIYINDSYVFIRWI